MTCSIALRPSAPGRRSFQGLPFLRVGIMACAPRTANGLMMGLGVVGANLVEQASQHLRVAGGVVGHFNSLDFQGRGINSKVHLTPLTAVVGTMFLRFPLPLARHLDAGTVA